MITNVKTPVFPAIFLKSDRKGLYLTARRLKTSVQTRNLWRGANQTQDFYNNCGPKRIKIYRRLDFVRMRGKPSHPWPAQIYNRRRCWGKLWERPKPTNIPEHNRATYSLKDFWGDEGTHIHKKIAQLKKEMETDPYGALFGRRLEPFTALHKLEDTCATLYRSIFGLDKFEKTWSTDTTTRSNQSKNDSTESRQRKGSSSKEPGNGGVAETSHKKKTSRYEFDPISGRMVLKKPRMTDAIEGERPAGGEDSAKRFAKDPKTHRKGTGYLSSISRTDIKFKATPEEIADFGSSDSAPPKSLIQKDPKSQTRTEETSVASSEAENRLSDPSSEDKLIDNTTNTSENGFLYHGFSSEMPSNTVHSKNIGPSYPGSSNDASQDDSPPVDSRCNNSRDLKAKIRDAKQKTENLDRLQASDIRSRYDTGKFDRSLSLQDQMGKEMGEVSSISAALTSDLGAQNVHKRSETHEQDKHLHTEALKPSTPSQEASKDIVKPQNSEQIDHTQSASLKDPQFAETYRVLAYDPSTLQITHAEASTSLHRMNEAHHPSEILSRLDNPAKFLPYFERMHADGYEITSGGEDILVFRKVFGKPEYTGSALGQIASEAQEIKAQLRNEPLLEKESTKEPESVSKQYPKSDNKDAGSADPPGPSASDGGSTRRGKADSFKSESVIGSVVRRMFISGAATAATCYAIVVVVEYFRTGGEDGLGIDAFTEFESERRRRDMEQSPV
ncbi:uncharacterized protein KD926_001478 [Aspergillus affinis]|uniref:uncharacterized protein n=1 Tax=Aspergillus affinis TaxID=1070780 RepID=UPI0022FF394D|nr:uncharacterized protein KD926_001478 [Aspergillus affinis]KAI9044248.1 hypothetical protein KD926_001478 [Aspergillus affinis]